MRNTAYEQIQHLNTGQEFLLEYKLLCEIKAKQLLTT